MTFGCTMFDAFTVQYLYSLNKTKGNFFFFMFSTVVHDGLFYVFNVKQARSYILFSLKVCFKSFVQKVV